MLAVVEPVAPGWGAVLEQLWWFVPWIGFLAGVLLFPWPKGVRCRLLVLGLVLSLIRQLYDALTFFGVFGPPRYDYEQEIPAWLEAVDLVVWVMLGMGGMILVTVGAWLVARGVVRVGGAKGARHA